MYLKLRNVLEAKDPQTYKSKNSLCDINGFKE